MSEQISIYTRVDADLVERLKIAAAKRRLKQPAAIAEAITQWVDGDAAITNSGKQPPPAGSPSELLGVLAQPKVPQSTEPEKDAEVLSVPISATPPLSPQEHAYLGIILRIERSTAPGLRRALRSNVAMFAALENLYERLGPDAIEEALASVTEGVGATDAAVTDFVKRAHRITGGIEGLKDDAETGVEGKKRSSPKTRKGRRA